MSAFRVTDEVALRFILLSSPETGGMVRRALIAMMMSFVERVLPSTSTSCGERVCAAPVKQSTPRDTALDVVVRLDLFDD